MKLYLAGPMRNYPEFNFPLFHRAAAMLRESGHDVFSPAENDMKNFGADIAEGSEGCEGDLARKLGMDELELRRRVFGEDMAYICAHAEGVALLPGWEDSRGAYAERAVAIALGLEVFYLEPAMLASPLTLEGKLEAQARLESGM